MHLTRSPELCFPSSPNLVEEIVDGNDPSLTRMELLNMGRQRKGGIPTPACYCPSRHTSLLGYFEGRRAGLPVWAVSKNTLFLSCRSLITSRAFWDCGQREGSVHTKQKSSRVFEARCFWTIQYLEGFSMSETGRGIPNTSIPKEAQLIHKNKLMTK